MVSAFSGVRTPASEVILACLTSDFSCAVSGRGQLFALGEGGDDAFEFQIAAIAHGDIVDMPGSVMQVDDFAQRFPALSVVPAKAGA